MHSWLSTIITIRICFTGDQGAENGLIQKIDSFDRKIEDMTLAIFGSNNSSTGL